MDEQIVNINRKLEKLAINFNDLKPFLKDYLFNIENNISKKILERDYLSQNLKKLKITVSSISKELNCSRTTLYNHDSLLKKYIEISIEEFNATDSFSKNKHYKEQIQELNEIISNLMVKDVKFELLKIENKNLSNSLKDKISTINLLEKRNLDLSRELHNLKKSITNSSTIIPLQK